MRVLRVVLCFHYHVDGGGRCVRPTEFLMCPHQGDPWKSLFGHPKECNYLMKKMNDVATICDLGVVALSVGLVADLCLVGPDSCVAIAGMVLRQDQPKVDVET